MDKATEAAIRNYIATVEFAKKHAPDTPVGRVWDCACLGPLPDCPCVVRRRLIVAFMASPTGDSER